jgi:hypothetical protein
VEDVLQESFLAVWRGARGYRPEGSPGGWLWGITRRQEGALAHRWATPWIWPTRLPHDRGGAICACLVIAAGLVLITVRGPRESGRESGPAS